MSIASRTMHQEVSVFDVVELPVSVGAIEAGARGGVLELSRDDLAMVEITSPSLEGIDRIVFVPAAGLRVIA